jgi:hypothetical protein
VTEFIRHAGCARDGWLRHDSDPIYGRAIESCDGCGFQRIVTPPVVELPAPRASRAAALRQVVQERARRARERMFGALPLSELDAATQSELAGRTGMTMGMAGRYLRVLLVAKRGVRFTTRQRTTRGPGQRSYRVWWREGVA